MLHPRLKVCCISSMEEARLAVAYGADAIGLVGPMPSGAGIIGDDLIATIAPRVPPPVASFLLSSRTTAEDLASHLTGSGASVLQIVQHIDLAEYPKLRRQAGSRKLVQVVHVEDETSIATARAYARVADCLLLDSGRPSLPVPEYGGTGRTHDWSLSRRIVEAVDIPVFLAGGIGPDNVAAAITAVRPYGIDLCSGVRTNGHLDETKLAALTRAMWGAATNAAR